MNSISISATLTAEHRNLPIRLYLIERKWWKWYGPHVVQCPDVIIVVQWIDTDRYVSKTTEQRIVKFMGRLVDG